MNHSKIVIMCTSFLILAAIIGGCVIIIKENNKEVEIKKSFEKTLSMYPIKNLEDLYDKEGYRDEEFEKDDKGTWLLFSKLAVQPKGKSLVSKGMVLRLNRNTRSAKGEYIISTYSSNEKGKNQDIQKKYPVKMENNKIIPTEEIKDDNVRKEIENFKFFAQYADFKDLDKYKNGDISYNPNVPSFSAEYDLENSNNNVKQLRKRYDIPTKQAPKLSLKGSGDLKGSSIGYKEVKYTFIQNQKEYIYFLDSVNFMSSEE
ncbi:tandem-type lipoprotein [Staphylococcus simulans]|uniref:tandem-type lipoprotein n=2 Tax=Staphylococcus simulans TaxID=1286 RepID=UPI0021D33153|nr:tandem-type lipoprotein [Staphylococcus simulans]UXR52571.1 tandem-type lipoprotein [Staphylococcus simulans]